jgi:ribosomal protein S18 acetylase RimI-like enzyme
LTIIDVTPDRYAECLEVLRAGFATEVADFGITRENTPSNPAFWDDSAVVAVVGKGFGLFAVEQDGRIVGCAFVGPSRSHPEVWSLRHLAVDPTTRHAGHGAALVTEGARRARAAGAEALAIGIVAENIRLSQWYRRLGFESIDKTAYPGLVFTVERLSLGSTSI